MNKTPNQIIRDTAKDETFEIIFEKKNGEVREYKNCTCHHHYEPVSGGARRSIKQSYDELGNIVFWAEDADRPGYRSCHESAVRRIVVHGEGEGKVYEFTKKEAK